MALTTKIKCLQVQINNTDLQSQHRHWRQWHTVHCHVSHLVTSSMEPIHSNRAEIKERHSHSKSTTSRVKQRRRKLDPVCFVLCDTRKAAHNQICTIFNKYSKTVSSHPIFFQQAYATNNPLKILLCVILPLVHLVVHRVLFLWPLWLWLLEARLLLAGMLFGFPTSDPDRSARCKRSMEVAGWK